MAWPVNRYHFFVLMGLAATSAMPARAHTLAEPNPVQHMADIVQFGVPSDSKYVFCDGGECPERTTKHLYMPPLPPAPPVMPDVVPAEQSIQPPPILLPVQTESPKQVVIKKKRKRKYKRRAVRYECRPITTSR